MIINEGILKAVGLRKVMLFGYKEEVEALKSVVNDETTDKAFVDWTAVVGPGIPDVKVKGQDMTERGIFVEVPKRIEVETFADFVRLPWEDQEDDQYNILTRLSEMIGRGHKVIREVYRANFFNLGFSTAFRTGYDGLALFSTAHLLQNTYGYSFSTTNQTVVPSRGATTWSNRLATDSDLDYTSLIDAITLLRRQYSREGNFINLKPRTLLVPPELENTAYEITKSTERPDTANRATSSINRFGISIVCSPYLLDTDAWFLGADSHDLNFFERKSLVTKQREAQGSWDVIVEAAQRFGTGFHDPRGWVGTPGA